MCTCHYIVQYIHVYMQALAGEVGMSAELDEVAKSLYNGQLPSIWRALAPATLKGLGNWIIHFHKRNQQYLKWVHIIMYMNTCIHTHPWLYALPIQVNVVKSLTRKPP